MTIRNMSPSTIETYIYAVAKFSRYCGRPTDKPTFEDVKDCRLRLLSLGYQLTSIDPIMGALRFIYGAALGRKEAAEQIATPVVPTNCRRR